MTVSVCTLVADRNDHLRAGATGLARSSRLPDELVVAWMGGPDPRSALGGLPFPVRVVEVAPGPRGLPLAAARNAAARAAAGDVLVFLDVDCVPGTGLVDEYARALARHDGLAMGAVRYLPAGATSGPWREAELAAVSVEHPGRPAPGGEWVPEPRYELFWSLSFAVRAATLRQRVGGFDEAFDGYGGEDTDLAFAARAAGVPLAWVPGAVAYHQDHPVHRPPLGHVEAIVRNARTFRQKWGAWPMEGWLARLAELGLVRWEGDTLELLRPPTEDELAATRGTAFPG